MNRMNLSLFQNYNAIKKGAKLTQSGRLFQCCIVRYSAIPPGQFSIGTGGQFSIGANTGGSEDFFNSANFGITGPTGATLVALSGTTYAAAVPEPAAVWLFGSGLSGLARKRKTA